MAGSVNKVILVGNLGKDPEVRTMNNGGEVVSFSIATSENWNDKASGERKEKTEWHNIVIFNENLGRIAEQYLRKGSSVYVEGQLQTRKWTDQNGNDRYTTEVVLQRFRGELTLLGGREGGGGSSGGSSNWGEDRGSSPFGGGGGKAPSGGGSAFDSDLDDDVPFSSLINCLGIEHRYSAARDRLDLRMDRATRNGAGSARRVGRLFPLAIICEFPALYLLPFCDCPRAYKLLRAFHSCPDSGRFPQPPKGEAGSTHPRIRRDLRTCSRLAKHSGAVGLAALIRGGAIPCRIIP